jgi:hypothetical protein
MSRPLLGWVLVPVVLFGLGCSSESASDHGAGGAASGSAGASGASMTSAGASAQAGTSNGGATSDGGTLPGEIPIVASAPADAPYQFGSNDYGIQGAAFFARAPMGNSAVMLDPAPAGKVCLKGTVDAVPTPPDGSHPPYSTYWGVALGFNLNQSATAAPIDPKTPWQVPPGVTGFWFTVEGAMIPPIRLKTTPTGKDPAQEQDSCALVAPTSGVPNQVLFKDMYVQCWDGPQGTAPTEVSEGLLDVSLQVAAGTGGPIPLDFCLTHFGVITN